MGTVAVEAFFRCKKCSADDLRPLDETSARTLQKALTAASEIIEGQTFKDHVGRDESWFANAGDDHSLKGKELLGIYPARIPRRFSIVVYDVPPPGENASTSSVPPIVTTYPAVVGEWNDETTRHALVNTLVHEMSHLISDTARATTFTDWGFSFHPCKQADLVSYKLGNMAECTYDRQLGPAFDACIDRLHHAMPMRWYTYAWGWWRAFCPDYEGGKSGPS
jgi:hypothetical protein